jgi:predicted O-methyltransferase YrrM
MSRFLTRNKKAPAEPEPDRDTPEVPESPYDFSNDWFDGRAKPFWEHLIPGLQITTVLEIGSYEGASACYLVDRIASHTPLTLHCIDSWEGGVEHQPEGFVPVDMNAVEQRFHRNIQTAIQRAAHRVDLSIHKGYSDDCLVKLIADGHSGSMDFIYVDGSHQAPDVLSDAVLAFKLLKVGGHLVFDDYIWSEELPYGQDPIRCPKPAIDAFTTLYCRKLQILEAPLYQLYVRKTSD